MNFIQQKNQGFSLIEVVVVLILIGILATFVLSKTMSREPEIKANREVIKNHIRYAQLMAMKSNKVCGIHFKGSTYSIFRNGSTADTIALPGSSTTDYPIADGLGTANETICFDLWGAPHKDINLTTIRSGEIENLGLTVIEDTGYVK